MARHKEFDQTEVLKKALEFFWNQGYAGSSVQELLKHLGIAKQSMYDTYGNKRDLFIAALKHYSDQKTRYVVHILEESSSKKGAIVRIFRELVETLTDAERCEGCFMVNTAIELAPHDQEIAKLVETNMEQEVLAFYQALQQAHAKGEISDHHKDLKALAQFLNNARYGLIVTAKSSSNSAILNDIVQITLSVLDD